ncbi:MAG: HD domain-containing phosphohydrolase [Dehalococcoidia bacterium]
MEKQIKILIMENIPEDAERIELELEKTALNFISRHIKTKAEYLHYLERGAEVIIADYGLPNNSAMKSLDILKEQGLDIPLIMVADADYEDHAEECLNQGAADFILKNKLTHLGPAVIHALEKKPIHKVESRVDKAVPSDTQVRMQKVFEDTVHALAQVTESRDPFTAGHQKRVASLSYGIAYRLSPDNNHDFAEVLYLAGLVHDIGKVAVPIEILSKPTGITDLEMQVIKTHPKVGYDILKKIDFPWPIAEMVLQHHERLDGSGYPNRLKWKEIMIEARILGVADVVEAICYPRSYRSALTIEQAMEEVSKYKGTLYDHDVADVCTSIFKEAGFSFTRGLEECDALRDANLMKQQ